MKPAGAVVLYHPCLGDVLRNIATYLPHIEVLVVFDNSNDGHDERQRAIREAFPDRVAYLTKHRNLGIATALNESLNHLRQAGFRWVLTMDQDSSFTGAALFEYFQDHRESLENRRVGVLAPDVFGRTTGPTEEIEHPVAITSGSLTNLESFQAVGGFADELFIDEVDHEYCLRLETSGYRVLMLRPTEMVHALGRRKEVPRKRMTVRVTEHHPVRYYYITRNSLRIWSRYGASFPDYIGRRRREYRRMLKEIVLYHDGKVAKFCYIARGFLDYLRGRFGPFGEESASRDTA